MINNDKSTQKKHFTQIAGVDPSDDSIEFMASEDETVLWMQNGCVHYWKDLPKWAFQLCQQMYLSDKAAINYLSALNITIDVQIELYVYHMWGDINDTPDIKNGKLMPSENFRHAPNHPSQNFDFKNITIDEQLLNDRDITIIDGVKLDKTDFEIACDLGITESTLSFHKKNLFNKVNVHSRNGLLIKAITQKV